jgi:hypothetical protein
MQVKRVFPLSAITVTAGVQWRVDQRCNPCGSRTTAVM